MTNSKAENNGCYIKIWSGKKKIKMHLAVRFKLSRDVKDRWGREEV